MSYFLKLTIASLIIMLYSYNSFAELTISEAGDYTQFNVPIYALGMTVGKNDEEGAGQFLYAFLATQATVHGMKWLIDAERPDGSDCKSFPSGHAACAFSGATFIHKRYGIEKAIVPYIFASFTGYSRMHSNKHYFHDVAAGAMISAIFTWLFVSEYDNGMQISVDSDSVTLSFRF